ncbi:MAG: STAS domain-containing protein [Leptonema sp. (in: bacteria)]
MEDFVLYNLENVLIKEFKEYWLIEPKTRLDLSFSDNFFNDTLNIITSNPKSVIINLVEVPYISSSGIKSILKLKQFLDIRGYKVALYNLLPEVKKVIHISELHHLLPIFENLEDSILFIKQ